MTSQMQTTQAKVSEDSVWAEKMITEKAMAGAKKSAQQAETEHIAAKDANDAATKAAVDSDTQKNAARVAEEDASNMAIAAEKAASKTDEHSEQALDAQIQSHGSEIAATASEGRGQDFGNTANMHAEDAAESMHLATKAYTLAAGMVDAAGGNAAKAAGHANAATTSGGGAVASAAEAQRAATAAADDSKNAGSAMQVAAHEDALGQGDQADGAKWMNMATKLSTEAKLGAFNSHQAQQKAFSGTGVCYEALKTSYPATCQNYEKVGFVCVGAQCAGLDVLGDRDTCSMRMPAGTMPNPTTGKCEPVTACWQALKTDYPACSQYEAEGYLCVADQCAAMNPQGNPAQCAKMMPAGTVPDPATGRCLPVEPVAPGM